MARDTALEWLLLAAEQGHPDAQFLIGMNYYTRYHENEFPDRSGENFDRARRWFEISARAENAVAMRILGTMLIGDQDTFDRGVALLEEAATNGDKKAADHLKRINSELNKDAARTE